MCVCVEHGIGPSIDRPVRSYVINKKSNHIPRYPYLPMEQTLAPAYPWLAARL